MTADDVTAAVHEERLRTHGAEIKSLRERIEAEEAASAARDIKIATIADRQTYIAGAFAVLQLIASAITYALLRGIP